MLTNQNTTQENSKKCSSRRNKVFKYISVLTIIMLITSILCINASALIMQEIDGQITYPELVMFIENDNEEIEDAEIQISGRGEEELFGASSVVINTVGGRVTYQEESDYIYTTENPNGYEIKLARYTTTATRIDELQKLIPFNINLWEWSQKYNDTIIWQIWDYATTIPSITANYRIQLPYFNNSEIMGTEPLIIDYNEVIYGNIDPEEERYQTYDLDLPSIEIIVEKAIEAMENESLSEISFQYKGEELREHNYVTYVYAEDGSRISIDFKEALSTVLIQCEWYINGNVRSISLLNYNNSLINGGISPEREWDFYELVIENEFERSAEITEIRKEKDVKLLKWLGNAISGIMNVEIFPNFSLGALLSVIIMIPIILWILKLVAGG